MGSLAMSIVGVVIAIALLMWLAYKGWNIIIYSALATVVVCVFCNIDVFDGLVNGWAKGTGGYVTTWLLLFLGGNIFGQIYQETGAAAAIANALAKVFGEKNPLMPILLASYILTMAGISSFVLIFCIYPIAIQLFAKANWSKRLLPAVFCNYVWTVSAVSPGSAQATNIIPTQFLGTTAMAGALPGFVFVFAVAIINSVYLMHHNKKLTAAGITFEDHGTLKVFDDSNLPNIVVALIPIAVIIIGFNVLGWKAEIALFAGIFLAIILMFKRLDVQAWIKAMGDGASTTPSVLVNTAVIVGFGNVIIQTPLYNAAVELVSNANINPYLLAALSANVFSLILGSATSSINLSMQTLGDVFLRYAAEGYNMGFVHRILSQAAMGLDTLPHCGALLLVFNVCGMDHKKSYKYVGFCTVICPVFVTFCIQVPLCMLLG